MPPVQNVALTRKTLMSHPASELAVLRFRLAFGFLASLAVAVADISAASSATRDASDCGHRL